MTRRTSVVPVRLAAAGRPPSFAVPDWLLSVAPEDAVPRLVLVESAGQNLMDLFAATALALDDAGLGAVIAVGDDRRDPETAAHVAASAVAFRPDAVVGHFGSRTARPAGLVYAAHGVPFLAPGSSADDLCVAGRASTRQFFGLDSEQLDLLATAAPEFGRSVEIHAEKRNYGAQLGLDLARQLSASDGIERATLSIAGRKADASGTPRVRDVAGGPGDADAIFILGSQDFAATVVARLPADDHRVPLVFSDDAYGSALFADPAVAMRSRIAFLDRPGTILVDRPAAPLLARAAGLLGRSPGAYFEMTYVAVRAFADAWRQVGSGDGAGLLAALGTAAWTTPYGTLRLDPDGRLTGYRWTLSAVRAPEVGSMPGHDGERCGG